MLAAGRYQEYRVVVSVFIIAPCRRTRLHARRRGYSYRRGFRDLSDNAVKPVFARDPENRRRPRAASLVPRSKRFPDACPSPLLPRSFYTPSGEPLSHPRPSPSTVVATVCPAVLVVISRVRCVCVHVFFFRRGVVKNLPPPDRTRFKRRSNSER